ncbi:hypothetical protein COLO4_24507 [Corchorus olitorius]|uniref:Uncharacterized protein n=1 Tax=Corchorus olitorius TaxID=93759 RepID=A0A1R3I9D5_9ROSI|nr:hypothetical protein COLO4_24507 [Corchorus olitorius]
MLPLEKMKRMKSLLLLPMMRSKKLSPKPDPKTHQSHKSHKLRLKKNMRISMVVTKTHPNPIENPPSSSGEDEKDQEYSSSSNDEKQEDESKTRPLNTPVPKKLQTNSVEKEDENSRSGDWGDNSDSDSSMAAKNSPNAIGKNLISKAQTYAKRAREFDQPLKKSKRAKSVVEEEETVVKSKATFFGGFS